MVLGATIRGPDGTWPDPSPSPPQSGYVMVEVGASESPPRSLAP